MKMKSYPAQIDESQIVSRITYPWAECKVGEGWIIPAGRITVKSARVQAYRMNKKLGRRFLVFQYQDGRIHFWRQS